MKVGSSLGDDIHRAELLRKEIGYDKILVIIRLHNVQPHSGTARPAALSNSGGIGQGIISIVKHVLASCRPGLSPGLPQLAT